MELETRLFDKISTYTPDHAGKGRNEVLAEIRGHGVEIHDDTLSHLRLNRSSGNDFRSQLRAADVLENKYIDHKIAAYTNLTQVLLSERIIHNLSPDRFSSQGYTEKVAEKLGIKNAQIIRILVRSMRADLISYIDEKQPEQQIPQLRARTSGVFSFFLDLYKEPEYFQPTNYQVWEKAYQNNRALGIYKANLALGPRSIGVLLPYEAEIFAFLYENARTLSNYDLRVLEIAKKTRINRSSKKIATPEFCVPVDNDAARLHRRVLLGEFKVSQARSSRLPALQY